MDIFYGWVGVGVHFFIGGWVWVGVVRGIFWVGVGR